MVQEMRGRVVKSILDLVVLIQLETDSGEGAYDIMANVHGAYGVMLSPGTLYPLLFSLERAGLIEGRWEDRRKVYGLTGKARTLLRAQLETYTDVVREVLAYLHSQVEQLVASPRVVVATELDLQEKRGERGAEETVSG